MFTCEIKRQVAIIGESRKGKTLELNRVRINGGPEQWDLRRWMKDPDTGEKKMLKGVCLSDNEMEELKMILSEV